MVTVIKEGSTLKTLRELLNKAYSSKATIGIDAHKYCGVLELPESPLKIQKDLQDEW